MNSNVPLTKIRFKENTDEFYTPYELIKEEVEHYKNQLANKVIYCNCDNPYKSEFVKYFKDNFDDLKLKRLLATGLNPDKNYGLYLKYHSAMELIMGLSYDNNGDFRNDECIEILKESNVVITNPPFSLFREFFSLLMKYKKKFLVIGNHNCLLYKEVFPYIMKEKVSVGYRFGEMNFKVPDDSEPREKRFWIDKSGQKWRSIGNGIWLTNLKVDKTNSLELIKTYNPEDYPKFDNFDAINVAKVKDIPKDYLGIMAVPLTYLKYHDKIKFEIVGEANHGLDNEFDLFKPILNGRELFKRILIKRR